MRKIEFLGFDEWVLLFAVAVVLYAMSFGGGCVGPMICT